MEADNFKKNPDPENDREAILFLHGLGGKLESADFLLKYLNLKGYQVYSPVLLGHENNYKEITRYLPEQWFCQAEEELKKIFERHTKVYLIGVSFGGNLSMGLAAKYPDKVRGIVLLEVPVFFRFKISFFLNTLQPLLEFFKVEKLKKSSFIYRSNYVKDGHSYDYIPIKIAGRINQFIKAKTRKELKSIQAPIFILQAEKSDLIRKKSARVIYDGVVSRIKRVEYLPLDNHDLDLFDENDKTVILEKIHEFLRKV